MNKIIDNQPIEEYIKGRYKDQINWYDKKSTRNKRLYYFFQWGVVILSAVTPVLVSSLPESLKWVTTLVTIALAIGTTALKTFKFQENWINYRTIAEGLTKEQYYMLAGIGDYKNSNDKYQLFVERVESLLSRESSLWITTHQEKKEPDKKDENK